MPSAFHSRRSARKDSVNREAEIDLSEDLQVKPVTSSKGSADLTEGEDAVSFNKLYNFNNVKGTLLYEMNAFHEINGNL